MYCRSRGLLFWFSFVVMIYIISIAPAGTARTIERGYHLLQAFFGALHQFVITLS